MAHPKHYFALILNFRQAPFHPPNLQSTPTFEQFVAFLSNFKCCNGRVKGYFLINLILAQSKVVHWLNPTNMIIDDTGTNCWHGIIRPPAPRVGPWPPLAWTLFSEQGHRSWSLIWTILSRCSEYVGSKNTMCATKIHIGHNNTKCATNM